MATTDRQRVIALVVGVLVVVGTVAVIAVTGDGRPETKVPNPEDYRRVIREDEEREKEALRQFRSGKSPPAAGADR